MTNLEGLLERLVIHQVEFVVVGGFAAMVHGSSYVTFDVDICCSFSRPNLECLFAAVESLHPYHRMTPGQIPFTIPPGFEKGLKNLYLKTDLGQLDCLGNVLGVGEFAVVQAHSQPLNLAFGICNFLDMKTLIQAKQTIGRDKDLLVAKELRAISEATQSRQTS